MFGGGLRVSLLGHSRSATLSDRMVHNTPGSLLRTPSFVAAANSAINSGATRATDSPYPAVLSIRVRCAQRFGRSDYFSQHDRLPQTFAIPESLAYCPSLLRGGQMLLLRLTSFASVELGLRFSLRLRQRALVRLSPRVSKSVGLLFGLASP